MGNCRHDSQSVSLVPASWEGMGDPPRTTDRMHRHKHRHEPTNKTQGPSAIARRPSDEEPSHVCLPISEGSCHSPDTRGDNSLVRICTVVRTVSSQAYAACCICSRPTRLQFLPASCNVAAQRQEEKDSFTVSVLCRRPREPGTSLHPRRNQRPSTINPNLIRPSSKRPFFSPRHTVKQLHSTLPETRIHSHTSAWSTTARPRCPCWNQDLLAIYLGVRTDVMFASTRLQQQMVSRAAFFSRCISPLHSKCKSRQHALMGSAIVFIASLSIHLNLLNLQSGRAARHQ